MNNRLLILLAMLLALGGCSFADELTEYPPEPAETLYLKGMMSLKDEKLKDAAELFQEVERQHPYDKWAVKAQVNLIYVFFQDELYEDAASAAERFIRLHPRHEHAPYAFYMRGLSKFRQISQAFWDQGKTREALTAFREILTRFPGSDYAQQAEEMLKLAKDRLAEQEMVVGRFYLDREQYVAALKRFQDLLENPLYKNTPYMEEALFSMIYASAKLGLPDEAKNYAVVLGHNFPNGDYYALAYDLLNGQGSISQSELDDLRLGVEEGNLFKRFLEGLAPGLPGMTSR